MLLSGFGTVFLGPVLPALTAIAHATDSGSGVFFFAQFTGAFVGGITTSRHLWRSLLRGSVAAALGFFALGVCTLRGAALLVDLPALILLGFGVGQMLTSTNLLTARRFADRRSATLAAVNFTWSLGALLGPFLLGTLLSYARLGSILLGVGLCFAAALGSAALNSRPSQTVKAPSEHGALDITKLNHPAFLYFALLLLLYGGVETSLSGWLTTFGTRYGVGTLRASSLCVTGLWAGITAGRGLTPTLLKRMEEGTLLYTALAAASLLTAVLARATGPVMIVALASLLGLALAPWFPLVLATFLAEGATATQAGSIIAVSGIGAACLPLLVGAVSRWAHSLRVALFVPFAGLVILLLCSLLRTSSPQQPRNAQGV